MKIIRSQLILFALASLCILMCAGHAVNNNALPEVNLPGIFLPNLEPLLDINDDPKPCCLPSQWQGNVTSQVGWGSGRRQGQDRRGGSGFKEQTATVYVDQDEKRIAGSVKCPNDTCGFIVIFNDDNTADNYFFSVGYKKCFHNKTDKAEFRKQCIPDNATFEGSVNIGPAGKGLGVNVWKYHGAANQHGGKEGQPKVLVAGKAVVTPDQCIPVMFQDHGLITFRRSHETSDQNENPEDCDETQESGSKRGHCRTTYFMSSSFFGNVEPSIKDPSVFNPPDFCKSIRASGGSLKMGVDMEYPDIIDRFVVLH